MKVISVYLLFMLRNCFGIKVPVLNKFKYSFSKFESGNEALSDNPVYLLLSHKGSGNGDSVKDGGHEGLVPKDVNVVNNNDYDDVLSSLKSRVFKNQPTVINFKDELNLNDKNIKQENKVDESVLKMSEIMLLVDRVIIPLDYCDLVKKGCSAIDELKLLGLLTLALNLHTTNYPKIHLLIYNYRPMGRSFHLNKYQKDFIERQKNEINETINNFLNSFISIVDSAKVDELLFEGINVSCSYVDDYNDLGGLLKQLYGEDHSYYKACMSDISDEFNKKLMLCESIDKCYDKAKLLKNYRFDFEEFSELESDFELYGQVLNIYKESCHRFYKGLKGILGDRVELDELKSQVNNLVDSTMNDYDTSVKGLNCANRQLATKISSEMRVRLYEKLRAELYKLNHGLLIQLLNKSDTDHQEDIKKLSITETIENDLSSLISKYDSNYCGFLNKIKYDVLKNYRLYDALTQSLRMELAYGLREYSNRIMGEVIKRGIYYYKFSALDGIRLLPYKSVLGFVKKLINMISMTTNIRISYLSPSAFGLSNLFKSQKKLGPSTCWYFTGKKVEK